MIDTVIDAMLKNPDSLIDSMPELPGAKELSTAPTFMREKPALSVHAGASHLSSRRARPVDKHWWICLHARSTQEHRADSASRNSGSATSAAIRRWLIRPRPKAWKRAKVGEGGWGEYNTRIVLMEQLGKDKREECVACAEGWAGDSFAVYEKRRP